MYNLAQLSGYAERFLKNNYGIELAIPIKFNGRMRKTCGWFKSKVNKRTGEREALCIELNKFFVENNEPKAILDVLRHELVHYALFEQGRPHKDGHPVFESELKKLNVVSQKTINQYNIKSKPININVYKCEGCEKTFFLKRALPNNGSYHRCNACKSNITYIGKRKMES